MSRSGYSDDHNNWQLIKWQGQVASAIRGKRGQRLLLDLYKALENMPDKRLIAGALEAGGEVCALGAVGRKRNVDMAGLNTEDRTSLAVAFDIAECLAAEVMYMNDEGAWSETPEQRWHRMRRWAINNLTPIEPDDAEMEKDG